MKNVDARKINTMTPTQTARHNHKHPHIKRHTQEQTDRQTIEKWMLGINEKKKLVLTII